MKVLGHPVTLEQYGTAAPSEDSESSAVQGCSIVISGVKKEIDVDDDLLPLLENERKGGGPVEKANRLSQTEDSFLITFAKQSSMTHVLFLSHANYTVC